MIFKRELIEKILAGEKTVTRRPVRYGNPTRPLSPYPCRYKVGRTYAIQPGRGKKAVGRIRILSVELQPLSRISGRGEAQREGFAHAVDFLSYWAQLYNKRPGPWEMVHRIEFELVGGQS